MFSLAGCVSTRCFGRDSSCPALLQEPPGRSVASGTGLSPSPAAVPGCPLAPPRPPGRPYNPGTPPHDAAGLGCAPFDRLYSGYRCYFLFLRVLRLFQFPAFASALRADGGIAPAGLPHSDIRGSTGICPSPRLFRSLSRPSSPPRARHPPCALPTPLCLAGIRDRPPALRGALRASGIQCLPWFARCVVFRAAGASAQPPRDLVSLPACQCPSFVAPPGQTQVVRQALCFFGGE